MSEDTRVPRADPGLSLALSPLLQPLRFATRAGVMRLNGLEALVATVVGQARAYSDDAQLDKLLESVRGFDAADEAGRAARISALVRELGALLPIPLEISTLAQPVSGGHAKIAGVEAQAILEKPADPLATPVTRLRGVGPAIAEKLAAKGLTTVEHLLLNLPRRYEDRRTPRMIADAPIGERSVISGRVMKAQEARGRRRRLEVIVRDDAGGSLVCIWYHFRPNLMQRFKDNFLKYVMVSGEVKEGYYGAGKVMNHPDVEWPGAESVADDDSFGRVVPIYSDVEGIPPRTFRRIEKRAVDEYAQFVRDQLPETVRKRRNLLPLEDALREAHFPDKYAAELAKGVP